MILTGRIFSCTGTYHFKGLIIIPKRLILPGVSRYGTGYQRGFSWNCEAQIFLTVHNFCVWKTGKKNFFFIDRIFGWLCLIFVPESTTKYMYCLGANIKACTRYLYVLLYVFRVSYVNLLTVFCVSFLLLVESMCNQIILPFSNPVRPIINR